MKALLLLVFLTLNEELCAIKNVQLVYPHQLRKAKVLEDLSSDVGFEDKELNAIITEPVELIEDQDDIGRVKKSLVPDEQEDENDDRIKKSLLNTFPFNQDNQNHDHGHHDHEHHHHEGVEGDHSDHHGHHEHHEEQDDTITPVRSPLSQRNPKPAIKFPFDFLDASDNSIVRTEAESVPATLNNLNSISDQNSDKKCIQKVMMVEETVFDEVVTCDHSYDRRCHQSYITTYESHQEEECEENFRKICYIDYEEKAYDEVVEVCHTPLVKDCNTPGPEVCKTEYETWCMTNQKIHEVDDDVPDCKTEVMKKCKDVTQGYQTKEECEEWPVQRCSLTKQKVRKYTPETVCKPEPREVCAPAGCSMINGPIQCRNETKTIVVERPVETCDIEPVRNCRHVTKQVPRLVPKEECVEVPKEVCARSKTNPIKKKRPIIKNWCYTPTKESGLL